MKTSSVRMRTVHSEVNNDVYFERRMRYAVVVEKVFGIPHGIQTCRVLFTSEAFAVATCFCPVLQNGVVIMGKTLRCPVEALNGLQSWKELKDCVFKIQARVWADGSCRTVTLGQSDIDMAKFFESNATTRLACRAEDAENAGEAEMPSIQLTTKQTPSKSEEDTEFRPQPQLEESHRAGVTADSVEKRLLNFRWRRVSFRDHVEHGVTAEEPPHAEEARFETDEDFDFYEAEDRQVKRISMETTNSFAGFNASKDVVDSPRGLVSASSSDCDDSRRSENQNEPPFEGEDAEECGSDANAVRIQGLEAEKRRFQSTIAQLEQDLVQSKNDTQSANLRVSTLANEVVVLKKRLDETSKLGRERSNPVMRKFSYNEGHLLRQASTNSDALETSSRASLASHKSSSTKSGLARSVSIAPKIERTYTQRSIASQANEEIEAHKLAFAEQLVEKEETIARLESQVESTMAQVRQLEAGIDGVETRFAHEMDQLKIDASKKFQGLFQKAQDLLLTSRKNGHGSMELKKDLQKLALMISRDIRSLEQTVQKKEQQKLRVSEEKRILKRKFDAKLQDCDTMGKELSRMQDELDDQKLKNAELQGDVERLEENVCLLNGRLADLTVEGTAPVSKGKTQGEIESLNERITSLESGLAEYETKNRNLAKDLEEARAQLDEICEPEDLDLVRKENQELRQTISDGAERIVDLEQENSTLKDDMDQLQALLSDSSDKEATAERLLKKNQEIEGQLARKKKHIDELQREVKELRLKVQTGSVHSFDSCVSGDAAPSQDDAVHKAEQRYDELEKVFANVQSERDQLLDERASKNKAIHSLIKENKTLSSTLKKVQKQSSKLTNKLDEAKAEVATLQGSMYSSAGSRHSSRGRHAEEAGAEIMQELVNAKVTLAENDAHQIKLRRDLHKSIARNLVLTAKASHLERRLKEMTHERSGFIRRKTTKRLITSP